MGTKLLELHHGDERLELEPVDWSSTRLHLFLTLDAFGPRLMELDVRDVQDLARELLQWLVDGGHDLPELPAMEDDLEPDDEDEPEPERGQPPATAAQYGELTVETPAEGEARIVRADPWVLCSTLLWDQLRRPGSTWASWDGTAGLVTIRASDGTSVQYRARPDVETPRGTVALEQTAALGSDSGPCPTCGKLVARPLLASHLSAHQLRGKRIPEHSRG